MLWEQEAVTCHINKGGKMGHIMRRCSTERTNTALEASVWCAGTENGDLVRQWHVYGWWAQASDFARRDCTLASGPSHLEHLGLKPFQETRRDSCWVEPEYSSFTSVPMSPLAFSAFMYLYLSYSFEAVHLHNTILFILLGPWQLCYLTSELNCMNETFSDFLLCIRLTSPCSSPCSSLMVAFLSACAGKTSPDLNY